MLFDFRIPREQIFDFSLRILRKPIRQHRKDVHQFAQSNEIMFKVNITDFDIDNCACADTCCRQEIDDCPRAPFCPTITFWLLQQLL